LDGHFVVTWTEHSWSPGRFVRVHLAARGRLDHLQLIGRRAIVVGWWPVDGRRPNAAFYALAFPPRAGFADATLFPPAACWDENLGELILDWDDMRTAKDPWAAAVEFAQSAFRQAASLAGEWPAERFVIPDDLAQAAAVQGLSTTGLPS
jgi:hypothetical protein